MTLIVRLARDDAGRITGVVGPVRTGEKERFEGNGREKPMIRSKRVRAVAVIVVGVGVLAAAHSAVAQQSGDPVTFLIPADSNQPDPPNGPTDKLIYTGGQVTSADATGCATGSFPVQNGVLVDPAGGRSGRIIGIITISHTDPLPPGTTLKSLSKIDSCTITATGTSYNRYQGIVQ